MPALANTFLTTNARGNREQLSDVVSRITPEDTPIYSMISKGSVKGTNPEWETDDLAAPATNVVEEGDEYAFAATTPAVRVGNYTQIMRKTGLISGTQDAADNAGRVEQLKYQKLKKAVEIRKDTELAILSNSASVAGTTRVLGGLPSWYTSNVSRGASGANGGFSSGTRLTVAATNGTQRAFTKAIMDSVMQQVYNSGGNPKFMSCSPYVKSVFVNFISDSTTATYRYNVTDGKGNSIVANADYYEGPFGKIMVVPNRVQVTNAGVARNAHFIDPEFLSFDWYRPIKEDKEVAKTGDAEKYVILGEGTLRVRNQAGLGVAADLFGLTAST